VELVVFRTAEPQGRLAPAIIEIAITPATGAGESVRFKLETATNMDEARNAVHLRH